jgi:hypothetical protein
MNGRAGSYHRFRHRCRLLLGRCIRWVEGMSASRKRRFGHTHYCHTLDHDHRWKCLKEHCLLHDTASCLVCRCGLEMVPVEGRRTDGVLIYVCPLRVDHIGHDSKVLDAPSAGATPGRSNVSERTP